MELVDFLRARLDEDEAIAREAAAQYGSVWTVDDGMESVHSDTGADVLAEPDTPRAHIARHDPARVLAEVEAKRQLTARGGPFCTSNCDEPGNEPMDPDTNWTTPLEHHLDCGAHEAAKLFVRPFRAHPDFDPAWLED